MCDALLRVSRVGGDSRSALDGSMTAIEVCLKDLQQNRSGYFDQVPLLFTRLLQMRIWAFDADSAQHHLDAIERHISSLMVGNVPPARSAAKQKLIEDALSRYSPCARSGRYDAASNAA